MNKTKITKSAGIVRLVVYGEKTQQISEYEYVEINSSSVLGLLRFDKQQKKKTFKLYYDITGFVSLRKYLKAPMNKQKFCKLLSGILAVLINVKDANFNQQKLLFDFRSVMINPATDGVFFVYLPIQPYESEVTLKEFLLGIVDRATFLGDEDTSYVQEYIKILNEGVNFSLFELEQYVDKIGGITKSIKHEKKVCPRCGAEVSGEDCYCAECGYNISKGTPHTGGTYNGHTGGTGRGGAPKEKKALPPEPEDKPKILFEPPAPPAAPPVTATGKTSGTVVLGTGDLMKAPKAEMERISNGSRYGISKNVTRIGSDSGCDITIDGNKYVSHFHAIITREGERYYIKDTNSTNHTYVDGRRTGDDIVELFNGTQIKLANEQFIFNIS